MKNNEKIEKKNDECDFDDDKVMINTIVISKYKEPLTYMFDLISQK